MGLLFSNEIRNQLEKELKRAENDIQIISAYCKKTAIQFVENCVANSMQRKRLMVRFSFADIVSGASDLEIYEFCRNNGWELYMRLDLHAKTYVFDKMRCIIGSANLTSRGVNLMEESNYEIAFLSTISDDELSRIDLLFDDAVRVDDELYKALTECASKHNATGPVKNDWDESILQLFNSKVDVLFTYDFPNCDSLSNLKIDSLDFLGLPSGWTTATVKKAFMKSNVYRWLKSVLEQKVNNEIYFGELSALIHDVIINDPKPYRKEVKELQSNLLNWIVELDIEEIQIDRPKHSQRIRLLPQQRYSILA